MSIQPIVSQEYFSQLSRKLERESVAGLAITDQTIQMLSAATMAAARLEEPVRTNSLVGLMHSTTLVKQLLEENTRSQISLEAVVDDYIKGALERMERLNVRPVLPQEERPQKRPRLSLRQDVQDARAQEYARASDRSEGSLLAPIPVSDDEETSSLSPSHLLADSFLNDEY